MKKLIALMLSVTMVFPLMTGCGSSTAEDAPVIIKFVHAGSNLPDDPQNVGAYYFEKILEERSNGYYDVQVYPNKQLGDTTTLLEGLQTGVIEMGDIESGPTASFVPAESFWDLPYMFVSWDNAHDMIDGEIGDLVAEKWLDAGMTVLGYNDGGFRHFVNSKRPIYTPEDLKSLKIRTMETAIMVDSLNMLGCSAIAMAFGEVYTAMQQGAIDGVEVPYNLIYTQAYYEVSKYISSTGHFFFLRHYLANSDWYESQPEDMQELIKECALEACAEQRKANYDAQMKYKEEMVTEYGMERNDVDLEPFIKIAREEIWPKYYQLVGELLGDGTEESGKEIMDRIAAASENYEIDLS